VRIAFKTYGCKANSVDTDTLWLEAKKRGYEVVDEELEADAYVINSCTVTGQADKEARLSALKYKRKNPAALVGVVGCYAQVAKEELLALPQVDFVLGTANKLQILELLQQNREETLPRDQVVSASGFLTDSFLGSRYARATIKIQDGCDFILERSEAVVNSVVLGIGLLLFFVFARSKNMLSRAESIVLLTLYAVFLALQLGNAVRLSNMHLPNDMLLKSAAPGHLSQASVQHAF
jgi:hypothetical protein